MQYKTSRASDSEAKIGAWSGETVAGGRGESAPHLHRLTGTWIDYEEVALLVLRRVVKSHRDRRHPQACRRGVRRLRRAAKHESKQSQHPRLTQSARSTLAHREGGEGDESLAA